MRIVCLSDTHTYGKKLAVPDGDLLIHAGDHTFRGTESEIKAALKWLDSLPHKHKVIIAGNHDFFFDPNAPKRFRSWSLYKYYTLEGMLEKFPSLTYLCDSSTEIEGVKIYGSPWQPWYHDWAFNFKPGEAGRHQAQNTWARVPDDTNILITHTPARGIRDVAHDQSKLGDEFLRRRIEELLALPEPALRLHVFGHIHESYGRTDYEEQGGHKFTVVNAANNNILYDPDNLNPVIVVDL